jgi:hypothetical protein
MKVIDFKSRPAIVHDSVIERLEEMLKDAREGKIASVALAAVNHDGAVVQSWSETDDFARLLGAVARLQYRINVRQDTAQADGDDN